MINFIFLKKVFFSPVRNNIQVFFWHHQSDIMSAKFLYFQICGHTINAKPKYTPPSLIYD
jgi:hypothetical protein